jgi:uncharacterized membrane protein
MNNQPPFTPEPEIPPANLPANLPGETPAVGRRPDSSLTRAANNMVVWVARHWLAVFNTAWAIYVFTPFLAPVLMAAGLPAAAQVIYSIYSVLCHQLPGHSYFLFGPELAPHTHDLVAAGMAAGNNLFEVRSFVGGEATGWKVALCQRDVAIYATVFVTGLLYGLLRNRLRPLPFKIYVLFLIPIAVDGLTQLVGWRESNWWLRTLTGALFGFGSVWFAYPYIEDAMQDVLDEELMSEPRFTG